MDDDKEMLLLETTFRATAPGVSPICPTAPMTTSDHTGLSSSHMCTLELAITRERYLQIRAAVERGTR